MGSEARASESSGSRLMFHSNGGTGSNEVVCEEIIPQGVLEGKRLTPDVQCIVSQVSLHFISVQALPLVRDNTKKPEAAAHFDTGELSSQGDGYAT